MWRCAPVCFVVFTIGVYLAFAEPVSAKQSVSEVLVGATSDPAGAVPEGSGLSAAGQPSPWLIRFSGSALPKAVSDSLVSITFSIYAEQTLGAALWSEVQSVTVGKDGKYTVLLGAKTPGGIPAEALATTEPRWLGVRIGTQVEGPRVLLVAVPYAIKAMEADRLAGHAADEFVTADTLKGAVRQEFSQQTNAIARTGTSSTDAPSQTPASPANSTNPATTFSDMTSTQVMAVQQNGSGVAINASAPDNTAIVGTSNATPIKGIVAGLEGITSNPTGYAIYGRQTSLTAPQGISPMGIYGRSDSPNGVGVSAWATGTGGTIGLIAGASSTVGIAVNASETATSGNPIGVVARVQSPGGTAALLINNGNGTLLTAQTPGGIQFSVDGGGNVTAAGKVTSSANVSAKQFISTVAPGSTPLQVASSTQVPNLNASLLGGLSSSGFIQNSQSPQPNASFNIGGSGTVGALLTAKTINTNTLQIAGPVTISGLGNGLTFPDGTTQTSGAIATQAANRFTGTQEAPAVLVDSVLTVGNNPAVNGQVTVMPDNLDSVHSWYGQAGTQTHFRLSRADAKAPKDFMIAPYDYGTVIEYPGVIEAASAAFSVHMNHQLGGNASAYFWVGDELDLGGLFATARYNSNVGPNGFITIAADKFDHTSHGKMFFTVRNPDDAFFFNWGPYNQESLFASIRRLLSQQQDQTNIESYSGSVVGAMIADSMNSAVRFGSRSLHPVQIFTGDGWGELFVYPSGNVAIGNGGDVARLAVGDTAQFQVSSSGAVTIGAGTPILSHLSVTGSIALADFNPNSCQTVSLVATGASDGDTVALGIPSVLSAVDGLTWFGFVGSQDTASIRICNSTTSAVTNLPSGIMRVDIWKH